MPDQNDIENAWKEWVRTGDQAKLGKLFIILYPQLVSFAYRILQTQESAEDVVQNLFINLMERRSGIQVNGPVRTYLYGAVRKESLLYIKRDRSHLMESIESALHLPVTDEEAESGPELEITPLDVQRAIAKLPDRTRLVFSLSREHGKSNGEIAAMLGVTLNTVNAQLSRAMELIRAELRRNMEG